MVAIPPSPCPTLPHFAPSCCCSTAQLEYGLLLFFDKQYEDAWQELGCVLEAARRGAAARPAVPTLDPEDVAQLEVLVEKVRLILALGQPVSTDP